MHGVRPSIHLLDDTRPDSLYEAVFWLEAALYSLALLLALRLLYH